MYVLCIFIPICWFNHHISPWMDSWCHSQVPQLGNGNYNPTRGWFVVTGSSLVIGQLMLRSRPWFAEVMPRSDSWLVERFVFVLFFSLGIGGCWSSGLTCFVRSWSPYLANLSSLVWILYKDYEDNFEYNNFN